MIDLTCTMKLISGALFDRESTWQGYLPEAGDWRKTAFLLSGPLIVVSGAVAYLLSLLSADSSLFGLFRPTIMSTLVGFATGAIAAGIAALVFSTLAGVFGGKKSFALGLAATALAFVPAYIGQALAPLPWIGGVLAFGLVIFSLVLLWKIIPLYLEVPNGKRAFHYISSLATTVVLMMLLSIIVSPMVYGTGKNSPLAELGLSQHARDSSFSASSGDDTQAVPSIEMFGDSIRRSELLKEAMSDTYAPPADGRLTEHQVQAYVAVLQQVTRLREVAADDIQAAARKADADGEMSIGDLGTAMKVGNQMGTLATAEMDLVKQDGGNWAEHRWTAQALLMASRQKNTNESIAYNYALYEKYAAQLQAVGL